MSKKTNLNTFNAAVVSATLMLGCHYTWAGPTSSERTIMLAQAQNGVDKSQAAEIAKKRYGGKVLKVSQSTNGGGKTVFKVRLLLDGGKIKTVTIDSEKGTVI